MKKKIIISVLVFCLLAFVAVMAFSQSNSNVRWEYNNVNMWDNFNSNWNVQRANELGQEGWELVAIQSHNWIFKRRLP